MNRLLIVARSIGRAIGINRFVGAILSRRDYEELFFRAITSEIKEGDNVWDVGANVGFYTTEIAKLVGRAGKVVAIEPNPTPFLTLKGSFTSAPDSLILLNVALSDSSGEFRFDLGDEDNCVDGHLVNAESTTPPPQNSIIVKVTTGNQLVADGLAPTPSVMKIDVEGFELEVLKGMKNILESTSLRAVFIEVHFGILARRGMQFAPDQIVSLMKQNGFQNCKWIDHSHLGCFRGH